MKLKNPWIKALVITALAILSVLIIALGFVAYRVVALSMKKASRPVIEVVSPQIDAVLLEGEQVDVLATVKSGGSPVERFEFYVDGMLAGSRKAEGDVLAVRWIWLPDIEGSHRLTFLATNAQEQMSTVELDVSVADQPDKDADGVPDAVDACPDVVGTVAGGGCPLPDDRDGDGIPDAVDACPDEPGATEDGCIPSERSDRDRDGYPDDGDRCPDEGGLLEWGGCPEGAWTADRDGDGVPDFIDTCPDRPGPAESSGCEGVTSEDRDGDGVLDALDACVDTPGSAAGSGCPLAADSDGDGMDDSLDACPESGGLPGSDGCPPEELPADSDGDGVLDVVDLCPETPGVLEVFGCPLPDDSDGDGVADEDDNCPDMPGSAELHGCSLASLPYARIAMQDILFPEFVNPCQIDPAICIEDLEYGEYSETYGSPNDADSDGIFDDADDCPTEYGEPNHDGCPDPDDTDFDGIRDEIDQCDHEAGPISNYGCPRTHGMPEDRMFQFYLHNFRTNPSWNKAFCYVNYDYDTATAGDYSSFMRLPNAIYMYELMRESGGGDFNMFWTTREFRASIDDYINSSFSVYCWGYGGNIGEHAQLLGRITREFSYDVLDGQLRSMRGESDFGWFEVDYRLCSNRCP